MKDIKVLREERLQVANEMKALLDESKEDGKQWTSDDDAKYNNMLDKVDNIDREINAIQKYLDTVADDAVIHASQEKFNDKTKDSKARDLYATFLRKGDKGLTAEDWQQINAAMSTGTGSEGGFTVQTEVASELIELLKDYSGMREVAEVFTTTQGNPMSFPTSDGTSEVGELVAENAEADDQDPSFGTVPLNVFKFGSKVVAVPIELLQDSTIDIAAFVNRRLAERIGRITNQFLTTGSGTGQPRGIITASTAGKVGGTGQQTTVTWEDLVDLIHSVDVAYRRLGASFMMHDNTMRDVRKLKDDEGRPVFLPSYTGLAGALPDTVMGYGVTINNDVPVMAASARSIAFGRLNTYKIRDAMQVSLFRFDDSAYIKKGQIGFLAWARSGGNLVDTTAVKHYQNTAA
ncbi:phage major capsid protein [Methylophaga lonarensis]|uniref:phage major capsid protein n=1 Tax=Methylophaga lonarensis TaxID=999151 RepID=UPI003D2A52A5